MLCLVCLSPLAFWVSDSSSSHAGTWWINTDGSDTNTGISWEEAFQPIQRAGNSAEKRDKIWVKEGTHALASRIDVKSKKKPCVGILLTAIFLESF
jgi:hypothetical protein